MNKKGSIEERTTIEDKQDDVYDIYANRDRDSQQGGSASGGSKTKRRSLNGKGSGSGDDPYNKHKHTGPGTQVRGAGRASRDSDEALQEEQIILQDVEDLSPQKRQSVFSKYV